MAGFQRRVWGNNGSSANAGQGTPQPQQQQNATYTNSVKGGNNNPNKLSINVKFGRYNDKGNLVFKLASYHFNDINLINNKYGNVATVVEKKTPNSQYSTIYLVVKPENIDAFKQQLPNIVNDLKATGHYNDVAIDSFEEKILNSLEKTPTPEEIAANEKVVVNNWKDLFNQLQDPETKKKFLAFQTTYTCQNSFKDAVLSPSNVLEVRLKDPQASFVTDASTWRTKFKRNVNPGSPFIIVTKSEQSIPPIKYLEADPVVRKNGGWQALCKKCGGPWYGEAWAAQKRVKLQNNLPTTYYKAKVYDVRFTTPIDPNDDPFVSVANLINNLTGEVNEAAKQIIKLEAQKNGETEPDFEKKKEGIETPEELLKFKDFILAKCKKENIKIVEIGSPEDVIANAVYAYAYEKAPSFNTLNDREKTFFASAVLYAVAHVFNIKSSKVGVCVNTLESLPDAEKEEIYQKTYGCAKQFLSFSIRESAGDISYEEYRQIFNDIDTKKSIKNKFDDLNNRMDNLYKD